MAEKTGYAARAVLAPRRPRLVRLALLLLAIAVGLMAWAGINGRESDPAVAQDAAESASSARPASAVETVGASAAPTMPVPSRVVGLDVERLEDVVPQAIGPDDAVAILGWYVATATTDCPQVAVFLRDAALPEYRPELDAAAFCHRFGVLYDSRPELADGRSRMAGLPAVAVRLEIGVAAPGKLHVVGSQASEVVVVGRFVESPDGCRTSAPCPRTLLVDHVAWTGTSG